MMRFTDIHAHFVYGVDDGAQTIEDMKAMLDAANANSIAFLFATSHVTPGLRRFDHETYIEHFHEAEQYVAEQNYPLTLFTGAELLYTPAIQRPAETHTLPTYGNSDTVLLEFSPSIEFKEIWQAVELMEISGYTTVLAHVERYEALFRGKSAEKLKQNYDIYYQINCSTITHGCGSYFRNRKLNNWFDEMLIDAVASDAHDCKHRAFHMKRAYKELKQKYGQREARRLTCAPLEILGLPVIRDDVKDAEGPLSEER